MDATDVPTDLIETKRAFNTSVTRTKEASAQLPSAADIAAGLAEITDEQRTHLAALRAESVRLAKQIQEHPWWSQVEDHDKARKALHDAAAD